MNDGCFERWTRAVGSDPVALARDRARLAQGAERKWNAPLAACPSEASSARELYPEKAAVPNGPLPMSIYSLPPQ